MEADLYITDDGNGQLTATMMYRLGDCEYEAPTFELQFFGPLTETVIGWDGEVIDSLMLE